MKSQKIIIMFIHCFKLLSFLTITYYTTSTNYLVHEVLCQSSGILHTTRCTQHLEQEDKHHLHYHKYHSNSSHHSL